MYVRTKKNKSGKVSVQIIDKSTGKYKVVKTIGSLQNEKEIAELFKEGQKWILDHKKQFILDFTNEKQTYLEFIQGIKQIKVIGTELLLGKIFNEIGFQSIKDELFYLLVLSRICFPVSKLRTTDYLLKYHGIEIDEDKIYRYLDKLYNSQKEQVQQISYTHTLKVLKNQMQIVFYDVTTLYFEIDDEDELRKTGFSKDGKHQHPQIVLGLLVSVDGYPLAYEIFEGNKFEGHTMLPIIERFKLKYNIKQLVIIADSGLLSNENINELHLKNYQYILGARIKNETQTIKEKILNLSLKNGESDIINKSEQTKLIISYSQARAKKNKANREKGFKKLEKQIKSGKLTKTHINN